MSLVLPHTGVLTMCVNVTCHQLEEASEQLGRQCQRGWCWGLRLPDWQMKAKQGQTAACLPAVTIAHWSACQ